MWQLLYCSGLEPNPHFLWGITCTYSSQAHKEHLRIGHTLSHKVSLNKFKITKIIPSIFSDHNGMKLEINKRRKAGKFTKVNSYITGNYTYTSEKLMAQRSQKGTQKIPWGNKMVHTHTCTHRGILLSHNKRRNSYHLWQCRWTWKFKWNKPDGENRHYGYHLYEESRKRKKGQVHRNRQQNGGCQELTMAEMRQHRSKDIHFQLYKE